MSGCEVYYCKQCGSDNVDKDGSRNEFSDADGNRGVNIITCYCNDCEYEEYFHSGRVTML